MSETTAAADAPPYTPGGLVRLVRPSLLPPGSCRDGVVQWVDRNGRPVVAFPARDGTAVLRAVDPPELVAAEEDARPCASPRRATAECRRRHSCDPAKPLY